MSPNANTTDASLTYKLVTNIPLVGPVIRSINETCNPNIHHGVEPCPPKSTEPTIYEIAKAARDEKVRIKNAAAEFMESELGKKVGNLSKEGMGEKTRVKMRREGVEEMRRDLMRVIGKGGYGELEERINGVLRTLLEEEGVRLKGEVERLEGRELKAAVEGLPRSREEGMR